MNILETRNLTKYFGSHKALDDVSLSLRRGSICGLLGPNGAGKTTFLRLINNVLSRDSGTVLFNGSELTREAGKHLGYMAEERGLYGDMKVDDQIIFFGRLRGGKPKRLREVMAEYMDIFEISQTDRRRKVKELSKGNQQKIQIIATLVHEPELVMLDEPFSGFDPINGALMSQIIERLKSIGTTIILSSHNMPAVEEICTSIALINHGKLLLSGPLADIKQRFRRNILKVSTSEAVDFNAAISKGIVKNVTLLDPTPYAPYTYMLQMTENGKNNAVISEICSQTMILSFNEVLPSLNELFLRFASGEEEPIYLQSETESPMHFEKLN